MNPWMSYRCMKRRSRRSCLKKSQGEKKTKLFSLSFSRKGKRRHPLLSLYLIQMNIHTHSHTHMHSYMHAKTAAHTRPQLGLVMKRFRSFPGTTVVDQTLQTPPQVRGELHKPVFPQRMGPRAPGFKTSSRRLC